MFILFAQQHGCRDSSGCISFQHAQLAALDDAPEDGPICCRACWKNPERNPAKQPEPLLHPLMIAGEIG